MVSNPLISLKPIKIDIKIDKGRRVRHGTFEGLVADRLDQKATVF